MAIRPSGYTATCDNGHSQRITVNGKFFTVESVKMMAGLLDGTCELFVHKPGPESSIGKCGICGAQIHCTVEVYDDADNPVFVLPQCIYNYCPCAEVCKASGCQHKDPSFASPE